MKRSVLASAPVHASAEVVAAILAEDPCAAFAPTAAGAASRQPTLVSSLTVDLPAGGSATARVELSLGAPEPLAGASVSFPIAWRAVGGRALFPEFDGRLDVVESDAPGGDTELRLEGAYRPPLRAVGAFADGLVLHRLARASLLSFLHDAARRIDAQADRRPRRLGNG